MLRRCFGGDRLAHRAAEGASPLLLDAYDDQGTLSSLSNTQTMQKWGRVARRRRNQLGYLGSSNSGVRLTKRKGLCGAILLPWSPACNQSCRFSIAVVVVFLDHLRHYRLNDLAAAVALWGGQCLQADLVAIPHLQNHLEQRHSRVGSRFLVPV